MMRSHLGLGGLVRPDLLFAVAGVLLVAQNLEAQSQPCSGVPFVNQYRPRAIEESVGQNVGPQIFDAAHHPSGFWVMANNSGLLEYDGSTWRLFPLGRSGEALSVFVARDGRLFAAGPGTFGEVVIDAEGRWTYLPLEVKLPTAERNFGDVWQIAQVESALYFRASDRIFALDQGSLRTVEALGEFSTFVATKKALVASDTQRGLVAIANGAATPLPGGDSFIKNTPTAMAALPTGEILIATRTAGVSRYDPASGKSQLFLTPTATGGREVTSLAVLADGKVVVGGLRGGLLAFDATGRSLFSLDQETGLPDDTILRIVTHGNELLAGTNGGAASLLLPSSVENFGPRQGLAGFVEALALHRGLVHAATSQGVFKLACVGKAFAPVAALREQAFALADAGSSLLVGTRAGVFELKDERPRLLSKGISRAIVPSRKPGRFWAGTSSEITPIEISSGGAVALNSVALPLDNAAVAEDGIGGVSNEIASLGEDENGRLFIALVGGALVSGTPGAEGRLEAVRTYGEKDGITGGFVRVFSLPSGLRIGTPSAVLLAQRDGSLTPDPAFANVLGNTAGAFQVREGASGFWVGSAKRPFHLSREGGSWRATVSALSRIPAGSRILDFLEVSQSEVWVGTDDGAFRYSPQHDDIRVDETRAVIRRAASGKQEYWRGGQGDRFDTVLPHRAAIRIDASSTSLDDPSRNKFRFKLDGEDSEWSEWQSEARKDYTNLGPGVHTVSVETRDVYGRIGREAQLHFQVETPWYLKPASLFAIPLGIAGSFIGLVKLRTRSLQKKNEALERLIAEKTRELREASFTDPLTGLRNRRYFTEVMDSEVSLAQRPDSPALHLFLVDIDHFKHINDTYGHAAGDIVLKETAARLKAAMRTSDLVFRWGGEEFLIVARGAQGLPRNELADRIVRSIGTVPFDVGAQGPLRRTCSVGFATFPFYGATPGLVPFDHVLELSDLALYRAKQTGRNRAIGVSPRPGTAENEIWRQEVLESLERAAVSIEVLEGPQDPRGGTPDAKK